MSSGFCDFDFKFLLFVMSLCDTSFDFVSDVYEIWLRYVGGPTRGSGGPTFETFKLPYISLTH